MSQRFTDAVDIDAPVGIAWGSLTRIEHMREWMGEPEMMIDVETSWTVGSPMVVRGFHYERFENTGVVLEFDPQKKLSYTHRSSLSQLADQPQNYTTLAFHLDSMGERTTLTLVATDFPTPTIFKHLELYWTGTLRVLKQYAERISDHDGRTAKPI
jgi:uncharacterized protein YndB with AHSA1/START domain